MCSDLYGPLEKQISLFLWGLEIRSNTNFKVALSLYCTRDWLAKGLREYWARILGRLFFSNGYNICELRAYRTSLPLSAPIRTSSSKVQIVQWKSLSLSLALIEKRGKWICVGEKVGPHFSRGQIWPKFDGSQTKRAPIDAHHNPIDYPLVSMLVHVIAPSLANILFRQTSPPKNRLLF